MKYLVMCILMFGLMLPDANAGKKQCQPYLDKLRNIQSLQRIGHSNKKARSLAKREQKARDKWWQCQQGKLPKKASIKKKKKKQSHPQIKQKPEIPTFDQRYVQSASFTNKVVIRGEFSGQKQQDWLDYYQPQPKCLKPSSTQVFAFCLDDRKKQRQQFVENYQK